MKTTNEKIFSKRSIYSLMGLVGILLVSVPAIKGWIIPSTIEIFSTPIEKISFYEHVLYMGAPIISYIIIGSVISLSIRIFKPIKSRKEKGLIYWLTYELSLALIGGLIFGLSFSSIYWLITGLTGWLIIGLFSALIYSLIFGLEIEFSA